MFNVWSRELCGRIRSRNLYTSRNRTRIFLPRKQGTSDELRSLKKDARKEHSWKKATRSIMFEIPWKGWGGHTLTPPRRITSRKSDRDWQRLQRRSHI